MLIKKIANLEYWLEKQGAETLPGLLYPLAIHAGGLLSKPLLYRM